MHPTRFGLKYDGAGYSVRYVDSISGAFIGLICLEEWFPSKYDDLA